MRTPTHTLAGAPHTLSVLGGVLPLPAPRRDKGKQQGGRAIAIVALAVFLLKGLFMCAARLHVKRARTPYVTLGDERDQPSGAIARRAIGRLPKVAAGAGGPPGGGAWRPGGAAEPRANPGRASGLQHSLRSQVPCSDSTSRRTRFCVLSQSALALPSRLLRTHARNCSQARDVL